MCMHMESTYKFSVKWWVRKLRCLRIATICGSCGVVIQNEENEGAARARPIPDMDTCPHRLRQSRPTNQTQIPLSRCANRAGLISLLFCFLFTSPLLASSLFSLLSSSRLLLPSPLFSFSLLLFFSLSLLLYSYSFFLYLLSDDIDPSHSTVVVIQEYPPKWVFIHYVINSE